MAACMTPTRCASSNLVTCLACLYKTYFTVQAFYSLHALSPLPPCRPGGSLYDADTLCLLHPRDVFGPMFLPPGTWVEAVSDIKLYCLPRSKYNGLPLHVLKVCVNV